MIKAMRQEPALPIHGAMSQEPAQDLDIMWS